MVLVALVSRLGSRLLPFLCAVLLPLAAHAEEVSAGAKVRWRLATSWSATTPVLGEAATRFADELRVASQGRLDLRIEEPAYHKSPHGVLDMVRTGTHDIGFTASHFARGRESPAVFFAALGFGLSDAERQSWQTLGGGLKRLQDALGFQGVWVYPAGNPRLESGLWTRRELKTTEDLRGLRLRVPGETAAALKRLGLRGQNLPLAELGEALGQGRIDAVEWPGATAKELAAANQARYFYPAWQDPSAEVLVLVNADKLAGLPADLRSLLTSAIKGLTVDLQEAGARHQQARLEQITKSKVELKSLSRELQQALREANEEALREFATRSSEFDEAYQERQAFLARWRDWARQGLWPSP
ncbi:Monocarboxylate 2-oxoacid-binding periplasmic protein [Burkholderiales bacterium]|nr:MAG: hypothetical protein F9K47_04175 [Burkholderiales bacterium]CAG1010914.1 Monocarboxylate 2-oxoacid-binding periplasmic protein [Burkholderiales bacterium]